jgi:hypothetical protein
MEVLKSTMKLSNEIIRKFKPCYDPASIGITNGEVLSVTAWVAEYRKIVKSESDIVWLLCRNEFMSDKDLRLFAVWCAREALKLVEYPDARSIEACIVAERFANGDATTQELSNAWSVASEWSSWSAAAKWSSWSAAAAAAAAAARSATAAAARSAASAAADASMAAARSAVWSARLAASARSARSAQVDKLLTYFE